MNSHHQTPSAPPQAILGLVAGLLLLMASTASAGSIFPIGSWPGYTRHAASQVAGDETTAYLVGSDGLQIMDLSDPLQPQAHSFLPCFTPYVESPTDIHLQGKSNRLCIGVRASYLGNYTYLLKGIDVSDPAYPVHVWKGDLDHQPNQVSMDANRVYSSHNLGGLSVSTWGISGHGNAYGSIDAMGRVVVANNRVYVPTASGMDIYDRSSLSSLLGTFNASAKVNALSVAGNYAYLAATNGLHVVELQNEAAPGPLGFLPLAPGEFEPTDIQLLTNHACLTFKNTNLLMVVDVSMPATPMWVGSFGFTGPTEDLSVSDGRALILAADESFGSADLHILDLSTPANPTLVSRLYAAGQSASLALQDSTLYVADGANGLCVLDVESPSNPQVIGHQVASGSWVAAADDWILVGSMSGYSVFDMSAPESPLLVTNSWDPAISMKVVDHHCYRIGGFGMPELVITDVSNNFSEVDRKFFIEGINQVGSFAMASNQCALLVDSWQGNLVVIDVQSTDLPILTNYVSNSKIVDVAGQIDGIGTNAFLATTNGLEILDLSDTNNIVRIEEWDCPPEFLPNRICVDGDRIGLASTNHLWVLDRHALGEGSPIIAEADITYSFSDMILSGNHLYGAAGADGVIVYQIGSTPTQPSLFISRTPSGDVSLEWNAAGTGWLLQQSEGPGNPTSWETVAGSEAVTVTSVPMAVPAKFFRLKRP